MATYDERARKLAHAKRMVSALETQLEQGVGVVSVSIDGASVTFNRKDAMVELEWYRKQILRYSRRRSRTTTMRLDTAHD